MKVKKVKVSSIVIPERARKDYKDIAGLATSMSTKGQIDPITINDKNILVAGGRRLAAAKLLEWEHIHAVIRPGDEFDQFEVELIENLMREDFIWHERAPLISKIHEMYMAKHAKWSIRATSKAIGVSKTLVQNQLTLAKYLIAIPDLRDAGSESDALKRINSLVEEVALSELQKRKQTEQEQLRINKEDTRELIKQAGDFISELHRDKTEKEAEETGIRYIVGNFFNVAKEYPKEHFGTNCIVECDPPYGIDLKNIKRDSTNLSPYNEVPRDVYPEFLRQLMQDIYYLIGTDSLVIFWFGFEWYSAVIYEATRAGFKVNSIPAIWLKLNFSGQNNQPSMNLTNTYEAFLLLKKGDVFLGKKGAQNIFMQSPMAAKKKIHPTERPEALIKDIFETCTQIELIKQCVVPFAGSGNTLRVCKTLGLPATGWDLSEEYYNKYATRDAINAGAIPPDNF